MENKKFGVAADSEKSTMEFTLNDKTYHLEGFSANLVGFGMIAFLGSVTVLPWVIGYFVIIDWLF